MTPGGVHYKYSNAQHNLFLIGDTFSVFYFELKPHILDLKLSPAQTMSVPITTATAGDPTSAIPPRADSAPFSQLPAPQAVAQQAMPLAMPVPQAAQLPQPPPPQLQQPMSAQDAADLAALEYKKQQMMQPSGQPLQPAQLQQPPLHVQPSSVSVASAGAGGQYQQQQPMPAAAPIVIMTAAAPAAAPAPQQPVQQPLQQQPQTVQQKTVTTTTTTTSTGPEPLVPVVGHGGPPLVLHPCRVCGINTTTVPIRKMGKYAWTWCVVLCMFTACFWVLPCCLDGCHDVQQICPNCGTVYKEVKGGQDGCC